MNTQMSQTIDDCQENVLSTIKKHFNVDENLLAEINKQVVRAYQIGGRDMFNDLKADGVLKNTKEHK